MRSWLIRNGTPLRKQSRSKESDLDAVPSLDLHNCCWITALHCTLHHTLQCTALDALQSIHHSYMCRHTWYRSGCTERVSRKSRRACASQSSARLVHKKPPPQHKLVQSSVHKQYVDVCKLHQWTGGSSVVQFNEEEEGNAGAVSMPRAATSTLSETHWHTLACTPLPITYLPLFSLAHISHPDFTYS